MQNTHLFTCSNGLTLLVLERHEAPVVAVHIGVETGSVFEEEFSGSGVSHLAEHLVFKGTAEFSAAQLNDRVADAGGLWNAYTSPASTVFHIHGPAASWVGFLHILVQLTLHPAFPESEWESEREVIRREMEMYEDDPDAAAYTALMQTLYKVHPCRWPVIGDRARFDALTRDDLLRYHARTYVPGNMFVCVVGDVQAAEVFRVLQGEVEDIPSSSVRRAAPVEEPRQWGPRLLRREFPRKTSCLQLAWRVPRKDHPDMPVLSLLCAVLGSGRSAWLYRKFHDELALAHDITAHLFPLSEGEGALIVEAESDPAQRDALRDSVLAFMQGLPDRDFAAVSQREKRRSRVQRLREFATIPRAAETLCTLWPGFHNLAAYDEFHSAVMRVCPQDLQRVARLYLTPERITEVTMDPIGSLPKVSPVSVQSAQLDTVIFTTCAGLRCALRPRTHCGLVYVTLAVAAGSRAETASLAGGCSLLAELLPKGTTAPAMTSEQIAECVENAGASLGTVGGENSILLTLCCLPEDAEELLRLLAAVALCPSLDAGAFRIAQRDRLAELNEDLQLPTELALARMRCLAYGAAGYGHAPEGTLEGVAALSREVLSALHRRLFVARNAVLSAVGDFDTTDMQCWIEKSFADMPPGEPLVCSPTPQFHAGCLQLCTPQVMHRAVVAYAMPALPLGHADMPKQLLLESWLSSMSGPLYVSMREQAGLVYNVESHSLAGADCGFLVLVPESSPHLLAKTRDVLVRTLRRIADSGISRAEMERARETALGALLFSQLSPSSCACNMALDILLGLGPDHAERTANALRAVSYAQVQKFVRRFMDEQTRPHCLVQVQSPQEKNSSVVSDDP